MSLKPALSIAQAQKHVDELVQIFYKHLQEDERLQVSEIIKAGSLGSGTAIPGDYDLDLVIYSEDIKPNLVVEIGIDNVLNRIDLFLRRRLKDDYCFTRLTAYSLQFKFHNDIDVDLLISPYWGEEPDKLHFFLEDLDQNDRNKFSCSAAKWQVAFFKKQPNEVKEYIKRFKLWRNKKWPKGQDATGRPKSFLLALLMVEAYKRSRDKTVPSIERELKQMIKNHQTLYIEWNTDGYYEFTYRLKPGQIKELIASGRFTLKFSNEATGVDVVYDNVQERIRHYSPVELPDIVDVANPFNNVYKSGIGNYFSKDPQASYHPGTGNWTNFSNWIDNFDLSLP